MEKGYLAFREWWGKGNDRDIDKNEGENERIEGENDRI